jgi:hypothetical protein
MALRTIASGTAAGFVATGAMSASMLAGQRAGLVNQLTPERITEAGLDVLGTPRDERLTDAVTTVNHFAYGAAGGAL